MVVRTVMRMVTARTHWPLTMFMTLTGHSFFSVRMVRAATQHEVQVDGERGDE